MSTRRMRSFLGGKLFSTSLITRRRRCGLRAACRFATEEASFRSYLHSRPLPQGLCLEVWDVGRGMWTIKTA